MTVGDLDDWGDVGSAGYGLDLAVSDLCNWGDVGSAGHGLDLAVSDLCDRGGGDGLDLAVGGLRSLSGDAGSEAQGEDDVLDGRHCVRGLMVLISLVVRGLEVCVYDDW